MLDRTDSNRPERRSALIAHELSRLDVDIAALSEVRFSEEGSLHEQGAGYTLFWSGKPATERRLAGVGFMLKSSIASKLENLPTGHSDRIMSMRLPLKNKQHATLLVCMLRLFKPILQKRHVLLELRRLLQSTPADDKLLILGDFNARVGQDDVAWKGVLGRHGVGKCNDNGRLLLELCMEQQLVITNTVFQQKDSLKTTWMHPRSKHWHLIDYVLVRGRDLNDILHTRSSEETIGFSIKKSRDWFDENNKEIQELLEKKRSAHQAHLSHPSCPVKKAAFRHICNNLQRKFRVMQNEWWTKLAARTQQYADAGDYRSFYEAIRAVYGPRHQDQSPLRSADGLTLLKDKTSILTRWSEHFQALFGADRVVQDSATLRIPQLSVKEELDVPPSLQELTKAIEQMKSGKAAGVDGIPPEIWKCGGPVLHNKLHELLVCCWEQGKLPGDLRDAVIITLYKNKGERSDCSNYRGITLLSIAGKIFARVLLNRLVPVIAEDHFPETQCGFRANRGTTDMVFVLRQLQEKCREQNKGLYITFVDLTKAFDTVSRKGLWLILERLGCPPRFLSMIIQLHENQRGQVRLNSHHSESFPITNGVKQGCVLAPTLFSIFFSVMLKQAMEGLDEDEAVYIRYRLDGSLFNLRRLQAHTKTCEQIFRDLLFADDAALVAHTERALQCLTSCFCGGCSTLRTRSQLEEDGSPPSTCTPGRVSPSSHHYWRDCVEERSPVYLPGMYNYFRRQD
nr:uncharacterized protein LOC129275831 [Lytechinus pictus]